MRPDLLEILKCLKCGATSLRLVIKAKNQTEVIDGAVTCNACGMVYRVEEGILNALVFFDPAIAAARKIYKVSKGQQIEKSKSCLARREHLEENYRNDTEENYRQCLYQIESGKGWALDIGAGTGWTTAGLASKGYKAVAVDISADNKLDLGKYHFTEGIYFDRVLADVNRLPFSDEAFDLAFASAALHHSCSLGAALGEISRTVKRGAKLELINEPVKGLAEAFKENAGHLEGPEGIIEKHYGISTWLRELKKAGFSGNYIFPANIRRRLEMSGFTEKHKFYYLARIITRLYRIKLFQVLVEFFFFRYGMLLFGLPLIYSGIKIPANRTEISNGV